MEVKHRLKTEEEKEAALKKVIESDIDKLTNAILNAMKGKKTQLDVNDLMEFRACVLLLHALRFKSEYKEEAAIDDNIFNHKTNEKTEE